jgi:hypothetical protein
MAIPTEFINFIVPIEVIKAKYPGGWENCLLDHSHLLQGRCWHDDFLFRNGAMNPMDMERVGKRWEEMGFVSTREVGGKTKWADFCVYEGLFGSAYECDWLVDAPDGAVAHINDPHPEIIKKMPKRTK